MHMIDCGKSKRLTRLLGSDGEKAVIAPFDDLLISGPSGDLDGFGLKVRSVARARPNAVLGFPGFFRWYSDLLLEIPWIVNLTASTALTEHTRKYPIASVLDAVELGADAVAVHVNLTSRYEREMIQTLARVSAECRRFGIPLLGIMYPRAEQANGADENYDEVRKKDPPAYAKLVSHCCRVAVELGADIVKTQYTGTAESFKAVIDSAAPLPIVIAGGPKVPEKSAIKMAEQAISAGAAGVSFGRNVFGRKNPQQFLARLRQGIQARQRG